MDSDGFLTHKQLLEIHSSAISAGLAGSRLTLLAGMDIDFAAGLAQVASPKEQILVDLNALNAAGKLTNDSIPLAIWLENAARIAGKRKEASVFNIALKSIAPTTGRSPEEQSVSFTTTNEGSIAPGLTHPRHHKNIAQWSMIALTLGSLLAIISWIMSRSQVNPPPPETDAAQLASVVDAGKPIPPSTPRDSSMTSRPVERCFRRTKINGDTIKELCAQCPCEER